MDQADKAKAPTKMPTAAYTVGYRRPPKHSQFKPGQSGNPSGKLKAKPSPLKQTLVE